MSTYPPDGISVSVGAWGTDADRNTALANLIGDSCVELKNTTVGTSIQHDHYIPLEGGAVYAVRWLVQADSIAGGNTVRLRTVEYTDAKAQVTAWDTHFAVLPAANAWYDMRSTFTAAGTTRYVRQWAIKAATAFTVYVDYMGPSRVPLGFSAFDGAGTALGAAAWTQIDLDTETYDYGIDFDHAAGYDFVAPHTGRYHFDGCVTIDSPPTAKIYGSAIYVNGAIAKIGAFREVYHAVGAGDETFPVTADLLLARGDSVELWAYNGSAGGLNALVGAPYTFLDGREIR